MWRRDGFTSRVLTARHVNICSTRGRCLPILVWRSDLLSTKHRLQGCRNACVVLNRSCVPLQPDGSIESADRNDLRKSQLSGECAVGLNIISIFWKESHGNRPLLRLSHCNTSVDLSKAGSPPWSFKQLGMPVCCQYIYFYGTSTVTENGCKSFFIGTIEERKLYDVGLQNWLDNWGDVYLGNYHR